MILIFFCFFITFIFSRYFSYIYIFVECFRWQSLKLNCEIKTTMRYHLTPVRMVIINKKKNNVLKKMWRKRNPHTLLVGT